MIHTMRTWMMVAAIMVGTACAAQEHVDPNFCGNKHKNLVILDEVLRNSPNAQVPPFLGISTGRVEQFLRSSVVGGYRNYSLFDCYHEVTERLNPKKISGIGRLLTAPFVLVKNLFRSHLRAESTEYLIRCIESIIQASFRQDFPFTQEELNFFDVAAQQGKFLMVRSTGVEDSPEAANAGGNVSVAYVEPTKEAVQNAMRDVVVSYFGMQSLKNRVASGERLSATNLVVPVLIQLLVGEPKGGALDQDDIPVSGVAYTTNQNISSPDFPITEINAAYGHGEGVVASKVMADRYLVAPSRAQAGAVTTYPLLYEKRDRLIPAADTGTLIPIKNSYSLAHKSALSQIQLLALYDVLKQIEDAYKNPMDVEFIVVRDQIYIVQARPTMHRPANPSYFDAAQTGNADTTSCLTIVPGTGALQILDNSADILVTRTLDEADQSPQSVSAKLVIVDTWASSLSHAAVNFMSRGAPCVYVQDIKALEGALATISAQTPLIVDIQRGQLLFWNNRHVHPRQFVKKGWFEHPIERGLSLFLDDAQVLQPGTPRLPKDPVLMRSMEQLKQMYNPAEQKKTLMAINTIVELMLRLTENRARKTDYTLGVQTQRAFDLFKEVYRALVIDFSAAIDQQVEHFEFLFYHKMLEALLYQVHMQQRILAGYTYSYFLNEMVEKQYFQRLIKKGNSSHARELGYAQYCPTQDLSAKWITFVMGLDALVLNGSTEFTQQFAVFLKFLSDLEQSQKLSLWFATSFYQKVLNEEISPQLITAIIEQGAADYNQQSQQLLMRTNECDDALVLLQSSLGKGFTSVSEAESRWQSIQQKLIDPLTQEDFFTEFEHAAPVLKMGACDTMRHVIDVVDGTIKEVKTSLTLSLEQRITLFKTMLDGFDVLFRAWVTRVMPEAMLEYNSDWPLKDYLAKMEELYKEILEKSTDDSMFKRSASFAVNAAMLGTRTAFERHYPESAEDMFMLIHQNTLAAVAGTVKSIFEGKPLSEQLYLAPILEACSHALVSNQDRQIIPIGVTYTPDLVTLAYNIPLNNHSGACQLIYNNNTQECVCALQFLGQARGRWEQIAFLGRISAQLSGLKLDQEVVFDPEAGLVTVAWRVEKTADMILIIEYINRMSNLSFERDLTLNQLYRLYRGTDDREVAVKKIIEQNIAKFGSSTTPDRLLAELTT